MDFSALSKLVSSHVGNTTENITFTELPPNILNALIPGYSIISRYITLVTGIDVSIFVTLLAICFGTVKGLQYLSSQAERILRKVAMSTVYIDDSDDLYDQVMDWLSLRKTNLPRRAAQVKSPKGSNWDEMNESTTESDALGEDGMFDYNKWAARTPLRFDPWYGRSVVWYNGRLFLMHRTKRESRRLQLAWSKSQSEDDQLQIDCIGFTIHPIQDLLRSIKVWSLSRQRHSTTIRHPTPKDRGRGSGTWSKTSSRPSRPMDTVILDNEQKEMIVKDMNEYLHPLTPKWYAERGIPYRRGYLFHGPPGTGKTSLSFALGGVFGLDIYVISLQEPNLTEGDLMELFNSLPSRCIVLLEDVDSAGLVRSERSQKDTSSKTQNLDKSSSAEAGKPNGVAPTKTGDPEPETVTDMLRIVARELRKNNGPQQRGGNRANAQNGNKKENPISLSGLLNAIDGVATHEGRILIMTTNHIEDLDPALVRPGRVDRKVEFRLAMQEQVRELFVRMYALNRQHSKAENKSTIRSEKFADDKGSHKETSADSDIATADGNVGFGDENQLLHMTRADVEHLAVQFASHFPDDTYTPAEIQNLLMRYKKQPRMALAMTEQWKREVAADREKQKIGASGREEADLEVED